MDWNGEKREKGMGNGTGRDDLGVVRKRVL
jgi:hypothetical protein